MKTTLPLILSLIGLFLLPDWVQAQKDTEFWFVAPKIWSGHSPGPAIFKIATGDQAADITIDRPADQGNAWPGFNYSIGANSIQHVNINESLLYPNTGSMTNDTIPDEVSNYGIRITSTAPITVYYENSYGNNNPDIYALKGRNALGTEFITPFQSTYHNMDPVEAWGGANPEGRPKSGFDVVATEDGTEIVVVPTAPVVKADGSTYAAGDTMRFTLNRGQTYRIKAASRLANKHLGGTYVSSNKAIAISTWDDSVHMNWCQDQIGDQLVPSTLVGTEYVVMKSLANSNNTDIPDQVILQPVEDNTTVDLVVQGGAAISYNVDVASAQTYTLLDSSVYISSDKPIYVFHLGGYGCELGGAIIPPLDNCAGSREVPFVRSPPGNPDPNNTTLMLNIVVAAGGEDDFTFTGVDAGFSLGTWADVPGTGGAWRYMRKNYGFNEIAQDKNIWVTNSTSLFQLGLINGEPWDGGAKYGYFSSFSNLEVSSGDYLCSDKPMVIDTYSDASTFLWSTGETTSSITVSTPDTYHVSATLINGCVSQDSIVVEFLNPSTIDLGEDALISSGSISLNGDEFGHESYVWSSGQSTSSITVSDSGTYSVTATGDGMCSAVGTIVISRPVAPDLQNATICEGASHTLDAGAADSYLWNTGESVQSIAVAVAGEYIVTVSTAGCTYSSSMDLTVNTLPSLPLPDAEICSDSVYAVDVTDAQFVSYVWEDASTDAARNIDATGSYLVTATDADDCIYRGSFDVTVNAVPVPEFTAFDTCFPGGTVISLTTGYTEYAWSDGSSATTRTVDETDLYQVTVTDAEGCEGIVGLDLTVRNEVAISDTSGCLGEDIVVTAKTGGEYLWSTTETAQSITISASGDFSVTATEDGCISIDDFNVDISDDPGVIMSDVAICDGSDTLVTAPGLGTFLWGDGSTDAARTFTDAGEYFITATAPDGCVSTGSFELSLNPLPTPELADFDTCFATGEIITTELAYDAYTWSNGSDSSEAVVDVAANYSVTVTDGNGCLGSTGIDVAIRTEVSIDDESACYGVAVDLTVANGQEFSWSTGESTQSISIDTTGTFSVTATEDGCISTDEFTITIAPDPGVTFTDTSICADSDISIGVPVEANVLWENGSTDSSRTFSQAGNYMVTATFDDGCQATGSFELSLLPLPAPTFIALDPCEKSGVDLTLTETFAAYLWDSGATTSSISVSDSGTFVVSVTDANGCEGNASVTLNPLQKPDLSLSVSDSLRCSGESTDLMVNIDDAKGQGPLDIMLSVGGMDTLLSQVSEGSITIRIDGDNSASINIDSVGLNNGCWIDNDYIRAQDVTANVAESPTMSVTTNGVQCPNGGGTAEIVFELLTGETPWRFSYEADGQTMASPELTETTYTLEDVEAGDYNVLSGSDGNGCDLSDPTFPHNVVVMAGPEIDLTPSIDASYGCEGPFFTMTIGQGEVVWTVEGSEEDSNPFVVQMGLGESKEVSYTVTDGGCEADTTVTLSAPSEFKQEDWLSDQNVFSPNADAMNDVFDLDNNDLFNTCSQIKVYNRWGTLIFESDAEQLDWDGESFVGPAPEGTYFAILEIDGIGQIGRSITLFR